MEIYGLCLWHKSKFQPMCHDMGSACYGCFGHSRRVCRMFKMNKTIELRYIYIVALTHNSYLAIVRLSEYNHAETIFRRDR
jgi:hypothetical protein